MDTIAALKRNDPDLARAVVALIEKDPPARAKLKPPSDVDLVQLTSHEALIVVDRRLVAPLAGIALLPLDDRRAFLALKPGQGFADLEVAVQDVLDEGRLADGERRALMELKRLLREWRRNPAVRFEVRSILVGVSATRRKRGA